MAQPSKPTAALTEYTFEGVHDVEFFYSEIEVGMKLKIVGTPRPMYRTHGVVTKDRKVRVFTPRAKNKSSLSSAIAQALSHASEPLFDSNAPLPVRITVHFFFSRPQHHFFQTSVGFLLKHNAPTFVTKNPDIDNLVKLLLDALQGLVYPNDNVVYDLHAIKKYLYSKDAPLTSIESQGKECMLIKVTQLRSKAQSIK